MKLKVTLGFMQAACTTARRGDGPRSQAGRAAGWALRGTKRAVNLHLEHAMARVMETALDAERDSMRSPEHVAIIARLIAKSR